MQGHFRLGFRTRRVINMGAFRGSLYCSRSILLPTCWQASVSGDRLSRDNAEGRDFHSILE